MEWHRRGSASAGVDSAEAHPRVPSVGLGHTRLREQTPLLRSDAGHPASPEKDERLAKHHETPLCPQREQQRLWRGPCSRHWGGPNQAVPSPEGAHVLELWVTLPQVPSAVVRRAPGSLSTSQHRKKNIFNMMEISVGWKEHFRA